VLGSDVSLREGGVIRTRHRVRRSRDQKRGGVWSGEQTLHSESEEGLEHSRGE